MIVLSYALNKGLGVLILLNVLLAYNLKTNSLLNIVQNYYDSGRDKS